MELGRQQGNAFMMDLEGEGEGGKSSWVAQVSTSTSRNLSEKERRVG